MAWVMCLVSASSRAMSGARSPSRTRAGVAAAAASAASSSSWAVWTGALSWLDLLVSQERGVAGGGAAQAEQAGVPAGFGRAGGGLSPPHPRGGGFLRRAGHQPVRVVGDRGVGVERVEGEMGARVAEVVLLPSPRAHSPAHLPGGQVRAGGQGVHLPDGPAGGGLAAGDLPQRDLLALARALGDLQ